MDYQKEYYALLAKFGEWELVSPSEFERLVKMKRQEFNARNCADKFTAGGARNICRLIALKLNGELDG